MKTRDGFSRKAGPVNHMLLVSSLGVEGLVAMSAGLEAESTKCQLADGARVEMEATLDATYFEKCLFELFR